MQRLDTKPNRERGEDKCLDPLICSTETELKGKEVKKNNVYCYGDITHWEKKEKKGSTPSFLPLLDVGE